MKLTLILVAFSIVNCMASAYSQKVSLNLNNVKFSEAINEISRQTKLDFAYSKEIVDMNRMVSISATNIDLKNVLDRLLEGTQLMHVEMNGKIYFGYKDFESVLESQQKQKRKLTGIVTNNIGITLPGVSITVKGTTKGAVTNANGEYELQISDDNKILIFSSIGLKKQEVEIAGRTQINVVMETESYQIDEVVVTALGIKKQEKALGYSVQKVKGDELQKTKGVYMATSLTGKVSGLMIQNSTEFNEAPSITLRGETPLLVIDGVAYSNMQLTDIAADNIESIDILKGGTASALYGYRGGSGAIIITTKNGKGKKGLTISVNSNNMVAAGFLALPKVQTLYGHGINGAISDDYVWGPKLDIGLTATQWNPITKQMENMPLISSGKNNFKNFLETSVVTNNNISLSQSGENGSFRVSLNHIYNKGQYPNLNLNTVNYSVAGEMKVNDKFNLEGYMGYNREMAPQTTGSGYGNQGYMYQMLMWTGPDYDIRQYRDYWLVKNERQNWLYNAWYDNPYLIANEKVKGQWKNKMNANVTATYKLFPGAKLLMRNGYDLYSNEFETRNPVNIYSDRGGFNANGIYRNEVTSGYSINSDLMLMINKKISKNFDIDAMAGGNIYRYTDKDLWSSTNNGLVIPGFYSLLNSKDPATVGSSVRRRQVNSTFGKVSLSYKNAIFIDATARNDWSSTQSEETRSFFYPSLSSSILLSDFLNKPSWLDLWKIRGSWALAKSPLGIYDNNQAYVTGQANWNGLLYADYPNKLVANNVTAQATRTTEVGTNVYFLKKFKLDISYFNKLYYNQQRNTTISSASGFSSTLINTKEEYVRRGLEISLDATVVKEKDFSYNIKANWSTSHMYYHKLDPVYSSDNLWTKVGKRTDAYVDRYWLTDPSGNIIHKANGLPWKSDYQKLWGYSDPDFIWGIANTITWKRFSFGFNFDGRVGGLMYNYTENKMWDTGSHPDSDNQWRYDEVVNHKTEYIGKGVKVVSGTVEYNSYGQIIKDTRVFAPNDIKVSYQSYARNYADGKLGNVLGTFFKLRDISLGYNLPTKVAKKIGASNLYCSLTGQNLFLWTKEMRFADPDKGTDSDLTSPSVRYIGMNINVTF